MSELIILPAKKKLVKEAMLGLAMLAFAAFLISGGGEDIAGPFWGWVGAVVGLFMVVSNGKSYFRTRPIFAGDADGFSVDGGQKLPWSDYRGVSAQLLTVGLTKSEVLHVDVEVGGKNKKLGIQSSHLPTNATKIAQQIEGFAAIVTGAAASRS